MKRTEPKGWPQPWKTPRGWITDCLGTSQNAVVANALELTKAHKPRKTDPPELQRLHAATAALRAHFLQPETPFPPLYVRMLGVDTGFANVGVMVVDFTVEFLRVVHWEKLTTTPEDGTDEQRLTILAGAFHRLFAQFSPDAVAYENVSHVGHAMGDKNASSARMAEVAGMIRMCCQLFACRPCYPVTTATSRKAIFGRTPRGTTRSKQDVTLRVGELLGMKKKLQVDVAEAGAVCFGGFNLHMEAERGRQQRT